MFRLLLMLCLLLPGVAARAQDEAARREQELQGVRERIATLAATIEQSQGRRDQLQQDLRSAEQEVSTAALRLRKLRGQVEAQARKLRETQAEQARAEQQLQRHKQALAKQVRAAYLIGKQGQTKLLLNQQDAQRLGRVMVYYEYLNRARGEKILAIQQQLGTLREIARRLQQEADALLALKQEQETALAALKASRQQRALALRQLKQRIAGALEQLEQLRQNEKDLQGLLSSLRDALADIPVDLGAGDKPFPAMKGRLQWPARGTLLARYGEPKAGGRLTWNGVWIDAEEGAPVKAVAGGRVAYVGWMQRYGLIIIVEHDGGYFSLYGHNQTVAKTAGEWVAAGEAIAAAGSSGGHERPGIYLEIRKGTQPLDPKAWLAR